MIAHAGGPKGRDQALVRTLYVAGLRVTETVDLVTGHLIAREDDRGGQLAVFGKGSKTRPVLVPRSLFDELSTLSLPDPTAPLFRSQKWPPGRCAWLGGCLIYTRGGKKLASVPLPGS